MDLTDRKDSIASRIIKFFPLPVIEMGTVIRSYLHPRNGIYIC